MYIRRNTMEFKDIIKSRRNELNLSLREAATKIGISHGYLDKLEKGVDNRTNTTNKPTPDVLKLIAVAYKLEYMDLMHACGYIDKPVALEGVYLRLAKEAQEAGLPPEDIQHIIDIYRKYKTN